MRKHIKIVPIFLSFLIFISSVYHFSFISYAEIYRDENGHPHGQNWSDIKDFGVNLIVWLSSQIGAVANYDFALFVQNQEAWKNLWTESNVTISDSEGGTVITFSDDLVAFIKQALKEYAEESCGFWIMPTVDFRLLPGSMFNDGRDYKNLKTIVNEKGIVFAGISGQGTSLIRSIEVADIYSNGIPMVYVCTSSSYDPASLSNAVGCPTAFYGADTWALCEFRNYQLYTAEEFNSFDEVVALNRRPALTSRQTVSSFYTNISGSAIVPSGTDYRNVLISKDGRRVQVFKSLNAYKSYDSGTRPVYFGSKFYEDSGPVEVSFEDLEKYLDGKYDDFWEKMKDLIPEGSNLSEEELEKLVDSILEQLGEIGGSIGDVNESMKETNSWLEKIYLRLCALDDYVESHIFGGSISLDISEQLDTIIKYLKKIKNWTMLDTIFDGADALADWISLIRGILSDADAGAESAVAALSSALSDSAGLMKKKFPFSVPWDILFFITVLSAEPETPRFEVPIDFTVSVLDPEYPICIDYDFVVDFTDYQYLSDISRTVLSMIYAVGLIKLTSGVITASREE